MLKPVAGTAQTGWHECFRISQQTCDRELPGQDAWGYGLRRPSDPNSHSQYQFCRIGGTP